MMGCSWNFRTNASIYSIEITRISLFEDLVFVYNNLRLLSRRSPNYNECKSKMWDVGGDGFD